MTQTSSTFAPIHVIGGGLAGSEAAWQIANSGVPVILHEMRGVRGTDAHRTDSLAELVCSNSFRSDDATSNAVGVIHAEMRMAGSLIMACADRHQVPAGGALAVDRDGFSAAVTEAIHAHPLITVVREEVTGLPPKEWDLAVVATGPLTSAALAEAIQSQTGQDQLAFSTPLRRLSIAIASTWTSAGISRVTTRWDPAARARSTSTARWTRRSTMPLSTP